MDVRLHDTLDGQVALVIGATRGIGADIATAECTGPPPRSTATIGSPADATTRQTENSCDYPNEVR